MRIGRFCYQRRRWVLATWVIALAAVFALGSKFPANFDADYQTPGVESTQAQDVLKQEFPERQGEAISLVFRADDGINAPETRRRVESVLSEVAKLNHVTSVISPYSPDGNRQISGDGRTAFAQVVFDITSNQITPQTAEPFVDLAAHANTPGFRVAFSTLDGPQALGSEILGMAFAIFILLVAFGSLIAMGLPVITALFGLSIGATLGGVASHLVMTPDWAATVATMIGLGVGIDYALFIVSRYRTFLAEGIAPEEATVAAMNTAGRAVLFAGGIVVVSFLGMLTMGLQYLHGVVASSVIAVLIVLTAAMTLLPAMMGFAGRNIDRLRLPGTGKSKKTTEQAFWYRWSRLIQHHPWRALAVAAALLAVLTAPVSQLRFGFPDDGNLQKSQPPRQAYDMLTEAFGPGHNNPLILVINKPTGSVVGEVANLQREVSSTKGVSFTAPAQISPSNRAAVLTVYSTAKPQSDTTENLVDDLRHDVIPRAIGKSDTQIRVGGFTAISIDMSKYIGGRLPLFIGAVVLLSFLLLTAVFRAPVLALKAGAMNLLSIGAAYGVMAYAVKGSWLGTLLNIPATPVPAFIPMIMFAILFGLSMDYEVFLLSRVREEFLKSNNSTDAVADGLALTARVITAAAAIMVFVFGVFVLDPSPFIKQIGLGLATAILVDASIVRMALVPATMQLLGNRAWWIPRWLDRVLPELHIDPQDQISLDGPPAYEGEKQPA